MQERHHYSDLRRLRSPSEPEKPEFYLEPMELQKLYDSSSESEFCVFEQFAGTYFMLWRKDIERKKSDTCLSLFMAGRRQKCTVDQVCRYSRKPLQHALLMFPLGYNGLEVQFQKDAMKIQKCILKTVACTSPRETTICETKYISRLIEIGLFGHLALRDEIYCQLIRQTNKSPNRRDCVFVFQIMLACLAMFPPSQVLHMYFEAHLKKCSLKTPTSTRRLTYMAQQCLKKLQVIKSIGARTFLPRLHELRAILKQEFTSLPVKFYDGQVITCNEIDSWSLVSYVKNNISKKIGLADDGHFSLIFTQTEKDIEIVVPENSSILSFLYQFCYNVDSTIDEDSRSEKRFNVDIFYKVKLFVNPRLTLFGLDDALAIQLYYNQTLADYLCGKVICSKESDLIDLASLALLSKVGRCPANTEEATKKIISSANSIIPVQHRHEFDSVDYEKSVFSSKSSTMNISEIQADESEQHLPESMSRVITGLNLVGNAANWVDSFDHDGASEPSSPHSPSNEERSSSTWKSMKLTESLTVLNLCEKIRRSWDSIELDLTSTTLAKAAFIEKVRSTYGYGARQFKVLVANSNASAQRWTQQILNKRCNTFQSELKLYRDRTGLHGNSAGVTSEHQEFFYYPDRSDSLSTLNSKVKRECTFFEEMPVLSEYESHEDCFNLTICVKDDRIVLKLKLCDNIKLLEKMCETSPTNQSVDPTEIKVDTTELQHSPPSFEWIVAPSFSPVSIAETECILNIPYNLIAAWGYSDNCFSLEYRVNEGDKCTTFLDEFRTTNSEGFVIKSLLEEYYGFVYKSMSPPRSMRSATYSEKSFA